MDRYLKFKIAVKPHLLQYLQDFYQLPYTLNQNDDLGRFLYQLLRRRKFKDEKYFKIDTCTASFDLMISPSYVFDHGCILLNPYQTHLLNHYLEDQMMNHAITWISAAEMAGMNNKAAIYKWIENYQLDAGSSDWYHRIKKLYFRFKKSKKSTVRFVP